MVLIDGQTPYRSPQVLLTKAFKTYRSVLAGNVESTLSSRTTFAVDVV